MLRRAQYCHGKSSVHMSVTFRYPDHIGWNISKMISWLISVWCSLSADTNIMDLLQKDHHEIPGATEIGEITCGIVLLLIYSFTSTCAFMQWMYVTIKESLAVGKNTPHRAISLKKSTAFLFSFCHANGHNNKMKAKALFMYGND